MLSFITVWCVELLRYYWKQFLIFLFFSSSMSNLGRKLQLGVPYYQMFNLQLMSEHHKATGCLEESGIGMNHIKMAIASFLLI